MPLARRLTGLWSNVGLNAKMTVIVVIGTIALIGLFAYLGTAALNEHIQRTLQERVALAQTTARHMDYVIASIEDDLTDIASQSFTSLDASLLDRAYLRINFYANRVFLLDRHARVVAAYPPLTSAVSLEQFASISAVLNGQAFAISRYQRALSSAEVSTVASAPVRDRSGQIIGALTIGIDLTNPNLRIFTQPIGLGETGYMDLVDLAGAILTSTRPERIGIESDHGETLSGLIRTRRSNVSTCHNCHTPLPQAVPEREMLAFAPLERAQWGVTVRQSEDEVFAATYQLQTRIFALMAIMLAGALVLVYLTTRSVIAPVQALTTATRRIAEGDWETRIEWRGRDEIGTLAQSFDAMRARLKDSMDEIQRWNRELEARVQAGVAARQSALEENRRLYAELQTHDQMRGELLRRLITAQEEERKRISRELHDETCQILTGLAYALDNAAESATLSEIPQMLEQMHTMTETALEGVHRIIFDLRPAMLDHLGLIPALRWYAESRLDGLGIQFRIRETGSESRLPPVVETALFRVVQEAINNIAQHSHAQHAELAIEHHDHCVEVRVSDDGQGFDPASVARSLNGKHGLGLIGMEERTSLIGGEFHIDSAPGKGTAIQLTVPIGNEGNGKDSGSGS
jgi:signal transduction histidine kinase